MNKQIRFVVLTSLLVITASQVGCVASMNSDFQMSGNAEGIRAYNDGITGVIRTGKETNTDESRYFNTREVQEKEQTKRELKKGFLADLFGSSTPATAPSTEASKY